MVREEAIAFGKRVIDLGFKDETQAFCELAIKALEQKPILDKIRAEIEQEKIGYPASADYRIAIMKCLQIIDKYKAESEDKE